MKQKIAEEEQQSADERHDQIKRRIDVALTRKAVLREHLMGLKNAELLKLADEEEGHVAKMEG